VPRVPKPARRPRDGRCDDVTNDMRRPLPVCGQVSQEDNLNAVVFVCADGIASKCAANNHLRCAAPVAYSEPPSSSFVRLPFFTRARAHPRARPLLLRFGQHRCCLRPPTSHHDPALHPHCNARHAALFSRAHSLLLSLTHSLSASVLSLQVPLRLGGALLQHGGRRRGQLLYEPPGLPSHVQGQLGGRQEALVTAECSQRRFRVGHSESFWWRQSSRTPSPRHPP
jgi:hypothetical protein